MDLYHITNEFQLILKALTKTNEQLMQTKDGQIHKGLHQMERAKENFSQALAFQLQKQIY